MLCCCCYTVTSERGGRREAAQGRSVDATGTAEPETRICSPPRVGHGEGGASAPDAIEGVDASLSASGSPSGERKDQTIRQGVIGYVLRWTVWSWSALRSDVTDADLSAVDSARVQSGPLW